MDRYLVTLTVESLDGDPLSIVAAFVAATELGEELGAFRRECPLHITMLAPILGQEPLPGFPY